MSNKKRKDYQLEKYKDGEVKNKLPSRHQIGESVELCTVFDSGTAPRIPAFVRAVIFTNSKVRYSLYLKESKSTIHNVDSCLVLDSQCKDKEDFGSDNYS